MCNVGVSTIVTMNYRAYDSVPDFGGRVSIWLDGMYGGPTG